MQAPTNSEKPTTQPGLLQDLQERAHVGLQTALGFITEHAGAAKQSAGDRLEVAQAAKKLLDEGGDDVAEVLLAKKATIVAADEDHTLACTLAKVTFLFEDSVAKLMEVQDIQQGEDSLFHLLQNHEERLAALRQSVDLLSHRISAAETSTVESDAIAMLQAKEGYGRLVGKSREGFEAMKQRTLASFVPTEASQEADLAKEATSEETSARKAIAPTLLQSLQSRAYASLQAISQAATDRVEVAKCGKKILDEGGEDASRLVVAKKAALDAAAADRDFADRVQLASASLESSAAMLKKSLLQSVDERVVGQGDFAHLAEEHELRARVYKHVAEMIRIPVASTQLSAQEWDALVLVQVKEGCNVMTQRSIDGVGHVKTRTAAACA